MTAPEPAPTPDPTPAPTPEPQPTGWMDSAELSTDSKANPTILRYQSAEALARGHIELQSAFGKDKIALPGKDAKPEEWDEVYSKLGRPETAEGYELAEWKPPEGVPWHAPEVTAKMIEKMHAHRLTKDQAQSMLNDYAEMQAEVWAAHQAQIEHADTETRDALKTKWGAAFEPRMETAKQAAIHFAGASGDEGNIFDRLILQDGRKLGDHPEILEMFASIGEAMGEDKGPGPGTVRTTSTPSEASDKLAVMFADAETNKILKDQTHPLHKQMYDKMTDLQKQLHPEE